ncbi:MAG: tetratricopeptide repeat protein [Candidatus Poribacteria bacterium]|nr:tetratricopeptide repeat protein [Candidatus Poribacteria bacterium]
MIFKTISYWVWSISFVVIALLLAITPLFNILAFEFCAIITICIAIAGAHVVMTELHLMKRDPDSLSGTPREVILKCFFRGLRSNIVILIIPLIIIIINGFRIKNCNYIDGFVFYFLLPILSCFTVTAAGLFFNVWIEKRWIAFLTYLGFLFLSCLPTINNLIFHPPVFAFHPIIGYFPGPIYDFVISITPTLLISRGQSLLWTLVFITILLLTCDINRNTGLIPKIRWRYIFWDTTKLSVWKITTVCVLFTAVVGVELYSGKIGIRPSRNDIAHILGGYKETEHFEIYYSRELEEHIDLFAEDCEFRYFQLSEYLQIDNTKKVRAYLYSSPEQKKRLIGAGNTFVEDPFGHGFHLHTEDFPHPVLKHELAHVLTSDWSPWKVSLNVGVHEGVAVAADWDEGKLTVHQWAKAMKHFNVAPALSSIMSLGFWRHVGSRSYLLAGSFIRYLIDTYGIEKVKQSFSTGNIPKYYNKDLYVLENEWNDFLNNNIQLDEDDISYAKTRLMRGGIFEQVCAHEMAALRIKAWKAYYNKDYTSATRTFQQMLNHEPENSITMRGLMFSAFRAGNFDLATSIAEEITNNNTALYRAEAAQLRGDIFWLQGDTDEAIKSYNNTSILEPRESVQLNNLKRITALSDSYTSESMNKLNSVLIPQNTPKNVMNGTKIALLLQIINSQPTEWLAYYLVGELLHKEGAWDMSSQYIHHSIDLGIGKDVQKMPNLLFQKARMLLGLNAYHKKDYTIAERIFDAIAADQSLSLGEVISAKDWAERCQWVQEMKP